MKEGGLIDYWIRKRTPKYLKCKNLGPKTKSKVVTISDFEGAIFVVSGGIGFSGLVFIIELLLVLKRKRFYSL